MNELAERSPRQLAAELWPYLTNPEAIAILEALLKKAEHWDGVCDLCYTAAVEEGKRQAEGARS